jgi:hypothetical protein
MVHGTLPVSLAPWSANRTLNTPPSQRRASRPIRLSLDLLWNDTFNGSERGYEWSATFAGRRVRASPRRQATLNGDEAPPCMRWRGLALPRSPSRRSLSLQLPYVNCNVPRGAPPVSASRRPRRSPSPSSVPLVSLGADPVFSGERFLLLTECIAQGLSARSSRFFSHPQDICCLSSVHGRFPPDRAQVYPQVLRKTPWALRCRTGRNRRLGGRPHD